MNEYFFTTIEGTTISPNLRDVENCQLLARVEASNVADARSKLLKENKWILEAGFSSERLITDQVIKKQQVSDIKSIVDYLWEELEHSREEDDCSRLLLFKALKRVRNMIVDYMD